MGLSDDMVPMVVKPLQFIPESGLQGYLKYLEHHMTELGMHLSRPNHYLLIIYGDDGLRSMVILPVDDSLGLRTE